MNKINLKFAAFFAFQTFGWLFFFAGPAYQVPVAAGCFVPANNFSSRRGKLLIGTLAAMLLLIMADAFYQPYIWAVRLNFPVRFEILIGIVWLVSVSQEYRSWRAVRRAGSQIDPRALTHSP